MNEEDYLKSLESSYSIACSKHIWKKHGRYFHLKTISNFLNSFTNLKTYEDKLIVFKRLQEYLDFINSMDGIDSLDRKKSLELYKTYLSDISGLYKKLGFEWYESSAYSIVIILILIAFIAFKPFIWIFGVMTILLIRLIHKEYLKANKKVYGLYY